MNRCLFGTILKVNKLWEGFEREPDVVPREEKMELIQSYRCRRSKE